MDAGSQLKKGAIFYFPGVFDVMVLVRVPHSVRGSQTDLPPHSDGLAKV